MTVQTMHEVVRALRSARSLLMSLHIQPDGDSIGATLAMQEGLRSLGKRVQVVSPDPLAPVYDFLEGHDAIVSWSAAAGDYDAVLLLDCADEARTGAPKPLKAYAPVVINVDHHLTNHGYGDICYIDPKAAAVGEVAAALLKELQVPLSRSMAIAIYTALVTDTGGFQYSATSPASHLLASELLALGVNAGEVSERLFERNSPEGLRLLGRALANMVIEPASRLAFIMLRPEDFETCGATIADAETLGLVNYARSVDGVEVGALFRPDKTGVKCSLRSKGEFDVSAFALNYGGGGHARAAGLSLPDGVAVDGLLQQLRRQLEP